MGAETLKRLATKTLVPNGEGFGGIEGLQPCDVAFGLAGIPRGPAALLRAMYAGDHGQSNMAALYGWAMNIANRITTTEPAARLIAYKAVDELVYAHERHCAYCNGTGRVQPNQHNPEGECGRCAGSGKRVQTDDSMAEDLGLTVAEWRKVRPLYVEISSEVQIAHNDAVRSFSRRMKNESE